MVAIHLEENRADADRQKISNLSHRYLSFLWLAFNHDNGRFKNFLGYDRRWLEEVGSDDSHGRALWSLGKVLGHSQDAGLRGAAGRAVRSRSSCGAHVYQSARMGPIASWECKPIWTGSRVIERSRAHAISLPIAYLTSMSAVVPRHGDGSRKVSPTRMQDCRRLILTGWRSDNQRMIEAGMDSLKWLVAEQHRGDEEIFVPVGSNGFYIEGNEKARFDQQPVEACATVSACLEVYRLTEESQWLEEARRVFCWFLGKNDLSIPLYDSTTGGCRDGLHPDRVNENQGAESTLSFLMAHLEMQEVKAANLNKRHIEMSILS